ncbi:NACHT, LRR and PYD domains-containing protein 12-like isoform X2 [Carassius carassius]|uniref:NACHT, LRR and PYD domains-containing protein 12-like isoform X2 n=1 Tax=Carassius carassius TaxID=217509 RepID=UPI002868B8E5|nr:NACHT, LRR and PYD domains-containing protein 12-like isoform X2 [Carassius carassius]
MASFKDLLMESLKELVEDELEEFQWHLEKDHEGISKSEIKNANRLKTVDKIVACFGPEEAVKIMVDTLRKMNQNELAEQLENKHKKASVSLTAQADGNTNTSVRFGANSELQNFLRTHKNKKKKKAKYIFEGNQENNTDLKAVYTKVFITEGDMKDVNQEHEIHKIDDAFKKRKTQDKPIQCNDIFIELRKIDEEKIVLTKGVAGIGKTVSVQKFILDWAEGNTNQDIDCMFLLPFRDINKIKDREVNLHEFLLKFYPGLKDLEKSKLYEECKLVFIFDGLDESQLPLDFKSETLDTVEERASVDVLFTSLVKGTLLPSALVWVTSRPAAANQIPPRYVGLFTEVRGFTDQQKEEYFRKRITDESLVSRIISHIKTSRSLYIMCHIPVFCWITATVLQDILINNDAENISTTLTEMYIHFLLIQMNMKNRKYDEKEQRQRTKLLHSNRKMILKLAKLAFKQLQKENIVFYEKDLEECGIDVSKDTEFTGMIAEIFKKENGLYETNVFCFVHLSVQEFLAAVHVFICYLNKNMQELQFFFEDSQTTLKQKLQFFFRHVTFHDLTKRATEKAMQSKRGHLDLFLRFLMGISLKSSQNLLKGLITHSKDTNVSIRKISAHIKELQKDINYISDETSVNLFYCLLELKDNSLYEEIKSYFSSEEHPGRNLSSSMCTVMIYILLMSEMVLDEFNPKRFDGCDLNETCCETVCSALQLLNSHLTELDLSSNDLQDSGVKLIYDGVKSPYCRLNILRLCGCSLTGHSCESLSSALQSPNCVLRELDLSNNDLQDSGVKLLSEGLKSPNCQLKTLRFSICNLTAQSCENLSSALQSSKSVLRELDLSNSDLQDSGVKLLSEGLKSLNCHLGILRLSGCMVTEEGCGYVSSALSSNPSHLRELDLSYNHPGDSGVRLLSEKLEDPKCSLEKLNVDHGGESRITAGLKKYACSLTLDPNTAYPRLGLSEEDRKAEWEEEKHPYPDHPDRFDHVCQVLCRESVCGRCYWEIEWSGGRDLHISVSYKSIDRKGGGECWFGENDQSWSLCCIPTYYSFTHNKMLTNFLVNPYKTTGRTGVYVDHSAGTLSFYDVSNSMRHIYTEQTTFTQTLYPGFRVEGGSVKLY